MNRRLLSAAIFLLLVVAPSCAPEDPIRRVLDERAQWRATLDSWVVQESGAVQGAMTVAGPVRSELKTLTVRFVFLDAAGNEYHEHWFPIDLSDFTRGVPQQLSFLLDAAPAPPDQLGLDPVPEPTDEQRTRIVELVAP